MTLYETIFTRRSVRKFDMNSLDETYLAEIQEALDAAPQLPWQSASFEIVYANELRGGFGPYAILAYADDNDGAKLNIGYTLQHMDLYLQSKGYGSIWCGAASPKDPGDDYRILLNFGKTNVPPRAGENDFKRKKITDISNEDNAIARAARLAPSAVNLQPWKLNFSDGKVTVISNVRGFGRLIPGKLHMFDLGIVLKHVELAIKHEGKTIKSITPTKEGGALAVEVAYRD
ncbi:MAG: hypothetical protein LBC58_02525 [Clostridiales Family XIII bacterium]|jgi:hypothetical protein|nr:hypothetical protein [Clostridiales Family XIII bacterium]